MIDDFENNRFCIAKMPRQVGKDLSLQTKIATPTGFRPMGELCVGDQVIDEFGNPTNVIFVSDTIIGRGYKITFDDGSFVECGKDHQWTVYNRLNQSSTVVKGKKTNFKHRKVTATIDDLYKSHWKRVGVKNCEYAYYIPNTLPIQYSTKKLNIDPYILGVWLGDGTSRTTDLTCHVDDVPSYQALGIELGPNVDQNNPSVYSGKILGLTRDMLRTYGLLQKHADHKTKHIPNDYMHSGVDQRVAVLQGLMDTDGHITKTGICAIQLTKKNQKLIDDVYTLLCSLGLKVTRKNFPKTESERLTFTVSRDKFDVCRLPRKLIRQKHTLKNSRYVYSRTIQNIEPLEEVVGKCIQVDSPNSLYLCTENHIPTHNTTVTASYLLHEVLFNQRYTIAILANKEKQAREILSRIKLMFEHLPKWMQQGVVEWNKGTIILENGSKIIAAATSSSSIRGQSINTLYLDEFAHVLNNVQEEFFSSVYPTISSGTSSRIIITSTPNGMNLFYRIWADSESGKNQYKRISVHWSMIPGRDEKWKEQTIANTSKRQFQIEFDCEFLGSSNTLISSWKLQQLTYIEPILRSGDVCVYEHPIKNHVYLTSVDTSRGAGIDYSVAVVFDITQIPYKIVAKYRNNEIESLVYPTIVYNLSRHYNDAYVLVEVNDVGQQVADILLHDLEYENVLMTKVKGRAGQKINSDGSGAKFALGVRTTTSVKRIGCANFKTLVENDKLIINDYDLLYEMFRFVEHNTKYQAEKGEHDDVVMCCVLFSWLVHQEYFKELANNDARLNVLSHNQDTVDQQMAPFGFIDDVWRDPELDVDPTDPYTQWMPSNGNW